MVAIPGQRDLLYLAMASRVWRETVVPFQLLGIVRLIDHPVADDGAVGDVGSQVNALVPIHPCLPLAKV